MRPTANFAFHAILAAALAALAASSAAAQYVAGNFQLMLGGESSGGYISSAEGGTAAAGGGHIEIESYQWGAVSSATNLGSWSKVDGLGVKMDPIENSGAASSDMAMKGSKIGENAPAAPPSATLKRGQRISAIPRAEVTSPRDIATGQASGKRQHAPASPGSLRVKVKMPWLSCRVGARYPELRLAGDGGIYRVKDAVVSSCGGGRPTEEIAFNYAKVEF